MIILFIFEIRFNNYQEPCNSIDTFESFERRQGLNPLALKFPIIDVSIFIFNFFFDVST